MPVRTAIRHVPLADVHALALPAAEALEAAAAQGRFFEALDAVAQAGFNDEAELLARIGQSVPDPERLRSEVKGGRFRPTIVEHIRQATASGVHGVPELFIDGRHYGGGLTRDPLRAALEGREWRAGSRSPRATG
jgi:protein-disulfide isomerase